ncbi:tetraspanin-2A-like [Panonychus citri]|uniref:tetraspanin-2A-like n=1 Tax=Panonychus citri TaxID=50023 RepID=UPI0023074102|nr:tetraspanin-2A-like [Panonychus citri]
MTNARCALYSANSAILCLGVILITTSIMIRADPVFYQFTRHLELDRYYIACYLSISSGIILIFVSFIGCVGVSLQKHHFFLLYCALVVVCVSLGIAVCSLVWKLTNNDQSINTLRLEILEHIQRRYDTDLSYRFLEVLQNKLTCCGAESERDYGDREWVPCPIESTTHPQGCAESLQSSLDVKSGILGGLNILAMSLQLLSVFIWFTGETGPYKMIKS